jgi:hypothetical protein
MKKKPEKEKLSKRTVYCKSLADKIHKINPTLVQVEKALFDVWDSAYDAGYQDRVLDEKKRKDFGEKRFLQLMNQLRDRIEDKIHQSK